MEREEMEGDDGQGGDATASEVPGGRKGLGDEARREEETAVTIVCARWAGYGAQYERPDGRMVQSHSYVTMLKPTHPLYEGAEVKLLAMPRAQSPSPEVHISRGELYDPHVCGVVSRIAETGRGWVSITIINHCRGNAVGVINLDVPSIPGVTIARRSEAALCGAMGGLGEAPSGCQGWRNADGELPCRGRNCNLELDAGMGEGSFRAIPKRTKGQEDGRRIEAPAGEGVFAIHLWLKYEGYD